MMINFALFRVPHSRALLSSELIAARDLGAMDVDERVKLALEMIPSQY